MFNIEHRGKYYNWYHNSGVIYVKPTNCNKAQLYLLILALRTGGKALHIYFSIHGKQSDANFNATENAQEFATKESEQEPTKTGYGMGLHVYSLNNLIP